MKFIQSPDAQARTSYHRFIRVMMATYQELQPRIANKSVGTEEDHEDEVTKLGKRLESDAKIFGPNVWDPALWAAYRKEADAVEGNSHGGIEGCACSFRVLNAGFIGGDVVQVAIPETFYPFKRLPIELRLDIWELSFQEHVDAKVHYLHRGNFKDVVFSSTSTKDDSTTTASDSSTRIYISHLASNLSPIPHVCKESRAAYFSATNSNFAFGTFVNWERDTIYLDDETPTGERATRAEYLSLLTSPYMSEIQNLAIRRRLFTYSPLSHRVTDGFDIFRDCLRDLKNLDVVMNEIRFVGEIEKDRDVKFKIIGGKEKRRWKDVGFVGFFGKFLNEVLEGWGWEKVRIGGVLVGTEVGSLLGRVGEVEGGKEFVRRVRRGGRDF